jgi:hypothetical protein
LQTAIIQLYLKRRHRLTDTAFDALCKFNHSSYPQGPDNFYPRSLWLMKKVAGVADARSVQVSTMQGGQSAAQGALTAKWLQLNRWQQPELLLCRRLCICLCVRVCCTDSLHGDMLHVCV